VNGWTEVFLGIIAVATLAIAIAQVGIFVAAGLVMRRMTRFVDSVERELQPIFGHVNAIGRDAARAAQLATAQVERVDRLFADIIIRLDQILNQLQDTLAVPAREGRALMVALRAAFQVIREARGHARARQSRSDDEDALFI
jgi:hypothetical protein